MLRDMRSPIISEVLDDLAVAREGEVTIGESSRRLIKGASVLVEASERDDAVERLDPDGAPTSRGGMLGPRMFERGSGCGSDDFDSFLEEVLVDPEEDDFLVFPEGGDAVESPFLEELAQKRRSW
jgi:hypothetical protein